MKTCKKALLWLLCAAMLSGLWSCQKADAPVQQLEMSGAAEPLTEPEELTTIEVTEAELPEPETTTAEVAEPETTVPETTEPETTAPETTVPETTEPETTEPETTEPETTVPETTAPPVTTAPPETTAPLPPAEVEAISVGFTELTMKVGETYQMALQVLPANAADKKVSITNSNNKVITVSGTTIEAIGWGSATLTISSANGVSTVCTVSVIDTSIPKYEAHVSSDDQNLTLKKTSAAKINGQNAVGAGVLILAGTTEEGSVVTITGSKISTMTVEPQGTRFFFSIKLSKDKTDTLYISAKKDGQRTSDLTKVEVEYARGSGDVVVGRMSQLHYPVTQYDYCGSNLFSQDELNALKSNVTKRLNRVRNKSGKDTVMIYVVAPNAATVYPETVPEKWEKAKQSDDSRLLQFARLIDEIGDSGIRMVNLPAYMIENKTAGKLYYQTDTHWNPLGAFFGYYQLMKVIEEAYPQCAPHELSDFTIYQQAYAGDLLNFAGLSGCGAEMSTQVKKNFQSVVKSGEQMTGDVPTSIVEDDTLPVAVVMRDSFGSAIYPFMTEHFSKMVFTPFNCGFNAALSYVESEQPDYVIQVLVERDLQGKVMG